MSIYHKISSILFEIFNVKYDSFINEILSLLYSFTITLPAGYEIESMESKKYVKSNLFNE